VDSKVKERIVGAAVLVALGVWLIPWVLNGKSDADDADAPPVSDTELLPAADDTAVHIETIELEPPLAAVRDETPPPEMEPEIDIAPVPDTPAASPADGEPAAAAVEPPPVVAAAPEPEPPAPKAAAPEPAAPEPDSWSVQLGSFGEPANARQLASRIADYGYQAQVSDYRSDDRIMHRVRVSGFATRAEAEAAASSLSAHGFVPRIFPPAE
jgi:DedD protein